MSDTEIPEGSTDEKLPEHIGGYQQLEPDVETKPGDLLVTQGQPIAFVPSMLIEAPVHVVCLMTNARVYRLNECPKNYP